MELIFKLTLDQANVILKYLGSGAYVEVESVINAMRQQAAEQLAAQPETTSEEPSNG